MRTSLYSILCIGIRLAAVLLAVRALVGMPGVYGMARQNWSGSELWLLVCLEIGLLILAFLLWMYPGGLARLAAGKASQQLFESPISGRELQYIAFSVVGLCFLFGAFFDLTNIALKELVYRHFVTVENHGIDMSEPRAGLLAACISNVVELGAGVALLLGARGLVGLLDHLRETSLPPAVSETTEIIEEGEKP